MSRICILSVISCAVLGGHCLSAEAEKARPNILFFLVDDQRNDTLGCCGHQIVKTPNVDRLAERGVRFENMFVTTSICAASRASIFTGLTERTHGYTFGKPPVSRAHVATSYPAVLRRAGYRTGMIGKFGINVADGKKSINEMFDFFRPIGRNPYFKKMPDGSLRHETELCGDAAVKFLRSQKASQPFCLQVCFNASHAEDNDRRPGIGHFPWPKAVDGMYDDVPMPKPRLGDAKYFNAAPEFLRDSMNRDRFYWRWDTPEKYETNLRAYFRMLSGVDNTMARVMKVLKQKGLADNTVIVYSADNGYYMGDRGFAGKWSHYEQSLRVPLIVFDPRLPKDKRGRVSDKMALNIDLPATFLALAGCELPDVYQGRSLLPIIDGQPVADWREDFFCEHHMDHPRIPKWRGVRGPRYVYANYYEQKPPRELLYDLKKDPDQLVNLSGDSQHKDILDSMRKRLEEYKSTLPERKIETKK
ncbi:MAG: sulfatase [Pirellulales bacterium]|nr:sulfatase [Pirellulales bacterium]